MLKFYYIIAIVLIPVTIAFLKYQCNNQHNKNGDLYRCKAGIYAGITQSITKWRKIAIDESRKQNNNRLQVLAQLGNDDELIGVLYILGIELEKI